MTDDQESSLFRCFIHLFIFFFTLSRFLWRDDSRKGSSSRSDASRCDSGPGVQARDSMQRRDTMQLVPKTETGNQLLDRFGKKICFLWWPGHSTDSLEWQGQLKAHHQAHDPQSQPGNGCDSLSFPVLVTHILNPCVHLLLQRWPLILNQLHHCCRALFIHLFRPMFIYRWPIRWLQVSAMQASAYIWIFHVWFIFHGWDLLSWLLSLKISSTRDLNFKRVHSAW